MLSVKLNKNKRKAKERGQKKKERKERKGSSLDLELRRDYGAPMPRPLRIEYPGAWYHVMNRGLRRFAIASGPIDRSNFFSTLQEMVEKYAVRIHAFALMDNHYHLLIETPRGNLSRAMRHLDSVYTQRFNKIHALDGPLFRGRFKSQLVEEDSYLLALVAYIHLNPARAGIEAAPMADDRSSHSAYVGNVVAPSWLTTSHVLRHFSSREAFNHFIMDQLVQPPESHVIWDRDRWSAVLGSDRFRERALQSTGENRPDPERPHLRHMLSEVFTGEKVIHTVAQKMNFSQDILRKIKRSPKFYEAQCIIATILVMHAGYTHRQAGEALRRSGSAISKMITRTRNDKDLATSVSAILSDLLS